MLLSATEAYGQEISNIDIPTYFDFKEIAYTVAITLVKTYTVGEWTGLLFVYLLHPILSIAMYNVCDVLSGKCFLHYPQSLPVQAKRTV